MNTGELDAVLTQARTLDAADELRHFRSGFLFPRDRQGVDKLYFCGNSLGLQHRSAADAVNEVLAAWSERAVDAHFTGDRAWLRYHELLRDGQANLAGALPAEVVTMNTLTVNLHLAMVSFYRPAGKRRRVLIEQHAFPSDRYAVESQVRFHGLDPAECLVELEPPHGKRLVDETQVEDYLREHGEHVALLLWPGVQYATGQVFDLGRLAEAGKQAGASVGFDLAHGMGNVALDLHHTACDFAAWCTYKYLNAGPGAIAGLFVHSRHHDQDSLPRFAGWFGNRLDSRFRMASQFDPAPGAEAWILSTPPILSMAPLLASLRVFEQAGFDRLRLKSERLTGWLAELIERYLAGALDIITPREAGRRGCQLSLRVRAGRAAGRALFEYLERRGAVPDWREPDVIRAAPVPLYNSFEDCARFVGMIHEWTLGAS